MSFQELPNPPAAGESSGGAEPQGRAWAPQQAARAALAFDYMDEEIEEVRIACEPSAPMPGDAIDPLAHAGRD